MSFLPIAGYVLERALVDPSAAGPGSVSEDEFVTFATNLHYYMAIIDHVFRNADDKADKAVTAASDASDALTQMGGDINDMVRHTYNVVIPHTVKYLYGYIESHDLVPLRERMADAEAWIRFLLGWRGQIDNWRRNWVDPNIADWRGFHTWFNGWPRGILFRWQDYFAHPSHFADWATPYLVQPIVNYLADHSHWRVRDELTQTIVDATPDVWRHVEEAALAILNEQYP